jgi:orotidine-5'-phosphate decarboxylase
MVLHHPEVIVALDLIDHSEALELAKKLAAKHGWIVVVRDADGIEIATIFPPTKH